MSKPVWFLVGTAVDLMLLIPGLTMAEGAVEVAMADDGYTAFAVAGLFCALPVFCIAAPAAAWRALTRRKRGGHAGILLAAPMAYAAFLTMFLFIS